MLASHGATVTMGRLEALARGRRDASALDSIDRRDSGMALALVDTIVHTVIAPLFAGASILLKTRNNSGLPLAEASIAS